MENTNFAGLLESALSEPGKLSECYSQFWNYSMGNQLLAMQQCSARKIQLGPISTFVGWKEKGRFVKKGEKAIVLCMPVTGKRKAEDEEGNETEVGFTRFIYKANWFVAAQSDGDAVQPQPIPGFSFERALTALEIAKVEFAMLNGNCQGYAQKREIAINPIADHPERTMAHEIAHVILGHTAELMSDNGERTPSDIRELEAEATSMLVCASLDLAGIEESRGYIQSWYKGNKVPEASAKRIFHAADQILKAGREEKAVS